MSGSIEAACCSRCPGWSAAKSGNVVSTSRMANGPPPASRFRSMRATESALLPRPIVNRVLVGGAGGHQVPTQRPLVGMVEALARIRLGRGIEEARQLQIPGPQQAARLLDQVMGVLARILVDRLGGCGLGAAHLAKGRHDQPV